MTQDNANASAPAPATAAVLAPDWQPDDQDLRWASERYPEADLSHHTERFIARCRAKGYRYHHPGAAWRAWLLDDLAAPAAGSPTAAARADRHLRPATPSAVYRRWQVWGELAAEGGGHVC